MNNIDVKKRRESIALFIPTLENDYSQELCKGIVEACEERDVNLIIFPGKPLNVPYEDQKEYNIIYEYADVSNIDGMILVSGSLCNYVSIEEYRRFCEKYRAVPIVSIAMEINGIPSVLNDNKNGLRQAIHHLIKEHGRRKILFIKGPDNNVEALERYSVYLEVLQECGIPYDPELVHNGDFTRFAAIEAIRDSVDKKGIEFDAVVATNDEMALFAMEELKKRNFNIPEDVSVIGYDNVKGSKFSSPSLSTINQPIYNQGKVALYKVLDSINGRKSEEFKLRSEFVIRESCGCNTHIRKMVKSSENIYEEQKNYIDCFLEKNLSKIYNVDVSKLSNFVKKHSIAEVKSDKESYYCSVVKEFNSIINVHKLNDEEIWNLVKFMSELRGVLLQRFKEEKVKTSIEELFYLINVQLIDCTLKEHNRRWNEVNVESRLTRHILQTLMLNIQNNEELLYSITEELKDLKINCCCLYIYNEEVRYSREDSFKIPSNLQIVMAYNEKEDFKVSKCKRNIPWNKVFNNEYLRKNTRTTLVVDPLIFKEEQLGLMVTEFDINNREVCETVVTQLSCILKMYSLILGKEKVEEKLLTTMKELEFFNSKLSKLSQVDELTGLYNRRGFMKLAKSSLTLAHDMDKTGVIFFGDMDGLKTINDIYGHEEGDYAIKGIADILRRAFRKSDIIARLAGDEFTIFTTDFNVELIEAKLRKIEEYCDIYNKSSGKPYKISISIGVAIYNKDNKVSLEELMARADEKLYINKNIKKKQMLVAKNIYA